jgi:hypothetical protein
LHPEFLKTFLVVVACFFAEVLGLDFLPWLYSFAAFVAE